MTNLKKEAITHDLPFAEECAKEFGYDYGMYVGYIGQFVNDKAYMVAWSEEEYLLVAISL